MCDSVQGVIRLHVLQCWALLDFKFTHRQANLASSVILKIAVSSLHDVSLLSVVIGLLLANSCHRSVALELPPNTIYRIPGIGLSSISLISFDVNIW